MQAEILSVDVRARLGESPRWDSHEQRLWWIDGPEQRVLSWQWAASAVDELHVDDPLSSLAFDERHDLLVTGGRTVRQLDGAVLAEVPRRCGGLLNDSGVDPGGRLHVGTAKPLGHPVRDGALLWYEPDGGLTPVIGGIGMSNGIAWDPPRRLVYYVDSWEPGIDCFDTDEKGTLLAGSRRRFAGIDSGIADGLAVDVEGGVWLARWGAGCVTHFAPDGRAIADITIPTPNATACTFGGPHLRHLFITSAADADSTEDQMAGRVFVAEVEVSGVPLRRVR